jgi:hypothetical protein
MALDTDGVGGPEQQLEPNRELAPATRRRSRLGLIWTGSSVFRRYSITASQIRRAGASYACRGPAVSSPNQRMNSSCNKVATSSGRFTDANRGTIVPISGAYSSAGAPISSKPIGSASLIARSTAATNTWWRVFIAFAGPSLGLIQPACPFLASNWALLEQMARTSSDKRASSLPRTQN